MENLIKESIYSGASFKEVEEIAERLTYKISYEHKTSDWRSRYEYLTKEDFQALGWKVICVGTKTKDFQEWLMASGYKLWRNDKILVNREIKTMFMLDSYGGGVLVDTQPYDTKFDLITLDEYKTIILNKLFTLLDARNKLIDFVNGLIIDHKTWMDDQLNDALKEQIIHQAIEEAKIKGVIK